LSIDGDNAYKRDLCDAIVGGLAMGAQNVNPPPADHWGQRFWDIGREEGAMNGELLSAAQHVLSKLDHPTHSVTSFDADALRAAISSATK
ncbi:hypothetical protein NPS46_23720, partial [Pseudomonas putida]|nr:hypothetical protein [Pseudomonas putida]